MEQDWCAVTGLIGSQDIKFNLPGTSLDLYICVSEFRFSFSFDSVGEIDWRLGWKILGCIMFVKDNDMYSWIYSTTDSYYVPCDQGHWIWFEVGFKLQSKPWDSWLNFSALTLIIRHRYTGKYFCPKLLVQRPRSCTGIAALVRQ